MNIKYIERSVWREWPRGRVGVGGLGCKDEKDRKENIKRNKIKNLDNKVQDDLYSEISGQLFDRTHKYFVTRWSFGNREN